ncbi:hypothetical protein GYA49_00420 [Candidatus Beckwithbacteria bacterium]|nr:hypothetical protein [Candidatus Beckwithbacteria bacterium]
MNEAPTVDTVRFDEFPWSLEVDGSIHNLVFTVFDMGYIVIDHQEQSQISESLRTMFKKNLIRFLEKPYFADDFPSQAKREVFFKTLNTFPTLQTYLQKNRIKTNSISVLLAGINVIEETEPGFLNEISEKYPELLERINNFREGFRGKREERTQEEWCQETTQLVKDILEQVFGCTVIQNSANSSGFLEGLKKALEQDKP